MLVIMVVLGSQIFSEVVLGVKSLRTTDLDYRGKTGLFGLWCFTDFR